MKHINVPRFKNRPLWELIFIAILAAILLVFIIISCTVQNGQQFSDLAQSFLHGQLNFLHPIGGIGEDPIFFHGKIFWGEGPLPAVILMPFVAIFNIFHLFFYQGYVQWILVLGIIFFIYKLAKVLAYSQGDSIILVLGFVLGSAFIGIGAVSTSWLFAQALTTFLLFWSLYEFYTHKRWWLIGIICGLVLLTRATATPIIVFFALELWQTNRLKAEKLKQMIQMCSPVVLAGLLVGLYNFLRFHNPFNGGYEYQLLSANSAKSRSYGVFSLIHVPANLYALILGTPQPILRNGSSWTLKFPYITSNPGGMSIFITSPYLLYLIGKKWSSFDQRVRNLIVAILVSAFFVLCFYGIGADQYGYRYSLDFLPELFLLFMIMYRAKHKGLSTGMKLLIICSCLFNFYLLWSFL